MLLSHGLYLTLHVGASLLRCLAADVAGSRLARRLELIL
jgi:hypothetical protein